MEKRREVLPDILKGFGIIMVVMGHCIQEGSGEIFSAGSLYFYDRWYQFIYSFHMPLFLMVSGYLCRKSMDRAEAEGTRRALLRRRAGSLLAPVFFWAALEYAYSLLGRTTGENVTLTGFIGDYLYGAVNTLWFLWAVWWCFLIVYIMHFFFRDNVILYGLGFLAMFFIPDGMGLAAYKFMLPYFVVSFYGCEYIHKNAGHVREIVNMRSVAAVGILFAMLFFFYDENSFIYLTGYKLIGKDVPRQIGIDIYRALTGFVGSGFFILLFQYLREKFRWKGRFLAALGTETMGIYIFSGYLIIFGVKRVTRFWEPSYLLNFAEMCSVLLASWGLTKLAGKTPVLRRFIGK